MNALWTRPLRGLVAPGARRRVSIALVTVGVLLTGAAATPPPAGVVVAGTTAAASTGSVPSARAGASTPPVTAPEATPGPAGGALGVPVLPPVTPAPEPAGGGVESSDAPGQPGGTAAPPADAGATRPTTAEAAGSALPPTTEVLAQPDPAVALGATQAAATTGVPDGTVLTPMTGEIRVRTPGQVIDGVDLTGCLIIEASNVVIRNSRISCRNPTKPSAVHVMAGNWNLLVEDSEIDGLGGADIGIGWNNYTLRRVEIRNVADGAKAGSNVTIEDSWIHDIVRKGDLHPDAIQSTGGRDIVIRGNYLDPVPIGATDVRNSAIQLGSENGDGLTNVLIEDNVLVGGNYTLNVRGDTVVQNVVVRSNTFNGPRRYGPIQAPPSVVFQDNTDLVAGGAVTRVNLVYS